MASDRPLETIADEAVSAQQSVLVYDAKGQLVGCYGWQLGDEVLLLMRTRQTVDPSCTFEIADVDAGDALLARARSMAEPPS